VAPSTRVTCSYTLEAAHRLPRHPGRCRELHGHSYRFEVTVGGPVDDNGMVIDCDELSTVVRREVLEIAGGALTGLRSWETPDSSVALGVRPPAEP